MSAHVKGRKPALKTQKADYINERVTRAWIYFHDGFGWYFDDEWLPQLSELSLTPGCNGVTADSTGRVDYNNPVAVLETSGCTVIRPYDKRLDEKHRPYYLEYDCIEGSGGRGRIGIHHRTVFETATRVGTRTIWTRDDDAWKDFLRSLIKKGIVEPMLPEVLFLKVELQQRIIDRSARLSTNPYFEAKYGFELEKLEAMQKAYEDQFADLQTPTEDDEPIVEEVEDQKPVKVRGRKPHKSA